MPSAHIAGTFATGSQAISNPWSQASAVLVIPTGVTSAKFNASPVDTNNRIRLYKSTDNGLTWNSQANYTSNQVNTVLTVAAGEHWIATPPVMQAVKSINYKLSVEV